MIRLIFCLYYLSRFHSFQASLSVSTAAWLDPPLFGSKYSYKLMLYLSRTWIGLRQKARPEQFAVCVFNFQSIGSCAPSFSPEVKIMQTPNGTHLELCYRWYFIGINISVVFPVCFSWSSMQLPILYTTEYLHCVWTWNWRARVCYLTVNSAFLRLI